jgi:hypothetical protein
MINKITKAEIPTVLLKGFSYKSKFEFDFYQFQAHHRQGAESPGTQLAQQLL